jgi:hypothetical protein
MNQHQKIGGIAALIAAATFIFGIVMFVTVLSDYTTGDPTPNESVAFLADHQAAFQIWNIVIYILFGIVLVPLVLALRERLASSSSAIVPAATAFGIIWATLVIGTGMIANIGLGTIVDLQDSDPEGAASVWSTLDAVQNGLGGGNEIVGGLWVLLISWAALQSRRLPAPLSYLGVASGVAGLITIVPAFEAIGAVFGLGLIVWFAWLGVVMIRTESRAT